MPMPRTGGLPSLRPKLRSAPTCKRQVVLICSFCSFVLCFSSDVARAAAIDVSLQTMQAQLTTRAPPSCIGDVAPPEHFKFERGLRVPSSAIMWCQPLLFEDQYSVARKCWSTHTCQGFTVYRRQHGGAWSYCLLSSTAAGGPDLCSTSSAGEWDPQEPCNGVYLLADERPEPPIPANCDGNLQRLEHFTFNRWRNAPGAHTTTTSCGTLGGMSHNDIAALCLRQPGCRAFSIFTRSSDGQRDYCLSSAGGPLAADLPAEWDMADTCNGVYVLEDTRASSFGAGRVPRAALRSLPRFARHHS